MSLAYYKNQHAQRGIIFYETMMFCDKKKTEN